jgi:RsiW-degrading membrane proteinase PrsW (M82 family)
MVFVGILLSVLAGLIPMVIYALTLVFFDRYEKEPPLLMIGVFLWGAIVAAGAALILNTIFGISLFAVTGDEALAMGGTAVISAPLIEETVKGLAVVGVVLFFRHEFDSLLDGVIYGSLVGFGFAATENINYIFTGFLEAGVGGLFLLTFIRAVVIAFIHPTFTSLTGIGFAVGRLSHGPLRYIAPVLGYFGAMAAHAFHNLLASFGSPLLCLAGSVLDWVGFLAMFVFILVLVWREGKIMRDHLHGEVALGNLSEQQLAAACSLTGQMSARFSALSSGRGRQTSKFYDLCGELAFKKYQLVRVGPDRERGTQAAIEKLRGQVAALSKSV